MAERLAAGRGLVIPGTVGHGGGVIDDRTGYGSSGFPSTAWTIVVEARGEDEAAQLAMEKLCALYWAPLYAFARRSGCSREDAEDATQGFFAKMIEGDYLERARREKGRLRSFLLTCFRRFLGDEREKARSQKRGGGHEAVSIDAAALEEVLAGEEGSFSPERAFDRRWAHAVLEGALRELEEDYATKGKADLFSELKVFLIPDGEVAGHQEVAERLGMRENAVGVAVYRLRKRFGELMKRQVMATVENEGEVEAELRHLMAALG